MEGRVIEPHNRSTKCPEVEEIKTHEAVVLRRLNEQRKLGKVCDITLISQGQESRAHICVLVTCSQYFEALHAEKDISFNNAQVVHLPEITSGALQQVLEYVYTGCLNLNSHRNQNAGPTASTSAAVGSRHASQPSSTTSQTPSPTKTCQAVNVEDLKALLHAADYLIMDELKDEIRKLLLNSVNVENCVEYMITAHMYCLQEVYEAARGVVMSRLEDYLQHSSDLCTIFPDEIQLILGDKKVKEVIKPSLLLDLLTQWVLYERRGREIVFHDKMFPNIVYDALKKQSFPGINSVISKMLTHELIVTNKKCKMLLNDLLKTHSPTSSPATVTRGLVLVEERDGPPKKRSRVDPSERLQNETRDVTTTDLLDLIVVNGFEDQLNNMAYVVQDDHWITLPELPEKRKNHGMVQHGHKLYIIGGCQRGYIPQEHCLNMETMTWSTIPPTSHTHLNVQSVITHSNKLYIISGDTPGESYDLDEQRWTALSQIQRNTAFLSPPKQILKAVSHGDFIYIVMSFKIDLFGAIFATEAQFHRYDPESHTWEQLQGPSDEEGNPIPITQNHALYTSDSEIILADPSTLRMTYHYDPDNRLWTCRSSGVPSFDSKQDLFTTVSCTWPGGAVFYKGHKFVSDWSESFCHLNHQCPGRCKWEWRAPPPFIPKANTLPILCHMKVPRSLIAERQVVQYCPIPQSQ